MKRKAQKIASKRMLFSSAFVAAMIMGFPLSLPANNVLSVISANSGGGRRHNRR